MDVCEHKGFCSLSCLCGSVCARMWFCDCLSSSRTWQIHFLPCSSLRLPEVLLAFVIRGDSYSLSCAGPDASRRSGTRLMGSPDQSAAAESFIWHRGSSPLLRVYGQTCISFFFLKDPTRLLSQSCKSSLELLSVQRTPKLPFIATSWPIRSSSGWLDRLIMHKLWLDISIFWRSLGFCLAPVPSQGLDMHTVLCVFLPFLNYSQTISELTLFPGKCQAKENGLIVI